MHEYEYLVTMVNGQTEDEVCLSISTPTDSFSEVIREILKQRLELGLKGYEIREILACEAPF